MSSREKYKKKYSDEDLKNALEVVRKKEKSQREASRDFDIPIATLSK